MFVLPDQWVIDIMLECDILWVEKAAHISLVYNLTKSRRVKTVLKQNYKYVCISHTNVNYL